MMTIISGEDVIACGKDLVSLKSILLLTLDEGETLKGDWR
jgi:hypothetical protein